MIFFLLALCFWLLKDHTGYDSGTKWTIFAVLVIVTLYHAWLRFFSQPPARTEMNRKINLAIAVFAVVITLAIGLSQFALLKK